MNFDPTALRAVAVELPLAGSAVAVGQLVLTTVVTVLVITTWSGPP